MSHFYGTIKGTRGDSTRCGTKNSGMETFCASWAGAIRSFAYIDKEGVDCVIVEKVKWKGAGESVLLYDGPIGVKK